MKLSKAEFQAPVNIGSWIVNAYVLPNKARMVSLVDFMSMFSVQGQRAKIQDALIKHAGHPSLRRTVIASVTERIIHPAIFLDRDSRRVEGLEADEIIAVCRLLLKAREYQLLETKTEVRFAQTAESFLVSIAAVGLVALIDEATGYQDLRDKRALQSLLDLYLKKEHAVWAKRFPDDFYKQIFRLQGWTWQGMHLNRPSIVGTYTRDIVYARLATGVLHELEHLNPRLESGERQCKHHQFLTDDIGHPALSQHLHAVVALMRASHTWTGFNALLKEAFPRKGDQLDLLDLRDSDLD